MIDKDADPELEAIRNKRAETIMSTTQAMTEPTDLNDESFEDFIKNTPIVVIDFWAEWCRPCKMVGPVLAELADEYTGKVWVGKVDVDAHPQIAQKYGASSIPTFWTFKEGVPVGRFVGAYPKPQFIDVFNQLVDLDMDKVREEMAEKEKQA